MAEEGRRFWLGFAPDTAPVVGERAMACRGMPSQGGRSMARVSHPDHRL